VASPAHQVEPAVQRTRKSADAGWKVTGLCPGSETFLGKKPAQLQFLLDVRSAGCAGQRIQHVENIVGCLEQIA
jgi:hypothetical protein